MTGTDQRDGTGEAGAPDAAATASEPARRWWHWRRLTHGRLRPAVGAAVVGALLGGAGVAWQAEAGPFASTSACWGALSDDDVAELFDGKRDIETSDVPVTSDHITSEGPSGVCRLKSPRGMRITARVHQLDTRFGGARDKWADEYLSARMTPLGDGLLGMASDTRAWLAIPEGCIGRAPEDEGPMVIDMETGWTSYRDEADPGERARLTGALIRLVNGYLAEQGCEGEVADPADRLPAPARFRDEKPDAICGIEGLRLPDGREIDKYNRPMVTAGEGPVRTCDRDVLFGHPRLRLLTVEDPRLSTLYRGLRYSGGPKVVAAGGAQGAGFVQEDVGFFQAECQTGDVTFLIRSEGTARAADIRALLPRYVTAEAKRVGCGDLRIKLPG
ncbi:hypothetical protein [Streptomyces sp. SYP-A7185]|uniref:hypothetical protein n=1 Tax=Streptomyces sp. SYP-A7185 TaxID=3040076 RepID=UPI0038F6DF3E